MRLKIIPADETIRHVALHGRLDAGGVNEIQYEFFQETTVLPVATMVDLSHVTFITSVGIGMLVSAAKHMERRGVKMVLLAPTEQVAKTLETSALHRVIPVVSDEAAAVALLR